MKSLVVFTIVAAAAVSVPAAFAVEGPALFAQTPTLQPIPAQQPIPAAQPAGPALPAGAQPVPVQEVVVTLYPNVRYKDPKHVAPCAVPQIVMVKDPCSSRRDCDPACVAVQICVPPCSTCPPKVTCRRGGEYVKYDFGKYRVEIRSKKGCVTVDYDA